MVGFIGFIIAMIVLGNIVDALSTQEVQYFLTLLIAALGTYRFTRRNLGQWRKIKEQKAAEDRKEQLRQEIEKEKERISNIQEIQPETIAEEPYYPEVKYFNK